MTPEQRNVIEWIISEDWWTVSLSQSSQAAIAAALADLDAANESYAILQARWDQLRVDRDTCCGRLAAALADLDACRAALRECEWKSSVYRWSSWRVGCFICDASQSEGHAPDCRLAAVLAAAQDAQEGPWRAPGSTDGPSVV